MSVIYEELHKKYNALEDKLKYVLQGLENDLIRARDDKDKEKSIPIYLTKCRLKAFGSCYLKTKRDNNIINLDDIKDLAGLRIICLFEEHVLKVHKFLMRGTKMNPPLFSDIESIKVFNWESEQFVCFEQIAKKKFPRIDIKPVYKGSGYKSVHYSVIKKEDEVPYRVEIQLRTLMQDVWGELEHKLNYKQGNIHPHIKKSFELLSRDLQTNDLLLNHLKNIYDREQRLEVEEISSDGPTRYFDYDDWHHPSIFKKTTAQNLHRKYLDFCKKKFMANCVNDGLLKEGQKKFKTLSNKIKTSLNSKDQKNFEYWHKMEHAYYCFASKKLEKIDEAKDIYDKVIKEQENQSGKTKLYVPYFRRGEIHFRKSEMEKALADFDRCESIANGLRGVHPLNKFYIKIRLAYIYWHNGVEFLDHAVAKINEAKAIYERNKKDFNETDTITIYNNLCWYHLEKYISLRDGIEDLKRIANFIGQKNKKGNTKQKNNKEFKEIDNKIKKWKLEKNKYNKKAYEYCNIIEKLVENRMSNPNFAASFDTIACFHYYTYLEESVESQLDKAIKYIRWADSLEKDFMIRSHFLDILVADNARKQHNT